MLRNKLKQIGQLAKIILFFTLFSVNIYLSCIYLRAIPESEYISGMFLGVFILQLFVSFLYHNWFMVAQQRNSYDCCNYVGNDQFIQLRIHILYKQQTYSIWYLYTNARLCVHLFAFGNSHFASDKKALLTRKVNT